MTLSTKLRNTSAISPRILSSRSRGTGRGLNFSGKDLCTDQLRSSFLKRLDDTSPSFVRLSLKIVVRIVFRVQVLITTCHRFSTGVTERYTSVLRSVVVLISLSLQELRPTLCIKCFECKSHEIVHLKKRTFLCLYLRSIVFVSFSNNPPLVQPYESLRSLPHKVIFTEFVYSQIKRSCRSQDFPLTVTQTKLPTCHILDSRTLR